MKLNNKGQVLVAFIILLPILLMLFTLVIDLGLMGYEKRNISNNIKDTIEFGLKNIDNLDIKNKMYNLLIKNIDDADIEIIIDNNYIKINVKKEYNRVFKILSNGNYVIDITYSGNIVNNKITLKKE